MKPEALKQIREKYVKRDAPVHVQQLLDHIAELERERDEAVAGAYLAAAGLIGTSKISRIRLIVDAQTAIRYVKGAIEMILALTPADALKARDLLVAKAIEKEANDWNVHAVNIPAAVSYEWRKGRLDHNRTEVARLTAHLKEQK